MRPIRTTTAVLAGSAALLGLVSYGPAAAAEAAAPAARAARTVDCGNGWNGLRIFAVTDRGASAACSTARRVSARFGSAVDSGQDTPFSLYADGAVWRCRERQGDLNPYQECVKARNANEKVRLAS